MILLEDLEFQYNGQKILRNLNLRIRDGEFVGIIGPNGAGKSTLLKIMDGILRPSAGQCWLQGKHLSAIPRKSLARMIGYVPQEFSIAFDFTVQEVVSMGRFPYLSAFGREGLQDYRVIESAMKATEVWELRQRKFNTLSGGEKQRVILASALAQEPRILLLDEPTSALDIKHQVHFLEILSELQQTENMTVVIATHDINLASQFCQRLIILKNGKIVAQGAPEDVITKDLILKVYELEVEIVPHPISGLPLLMVNKNNTSSVKLNL